MFIVRNIIDIMSKSRKKFPAGTYCCKSQERGKQFSNRRFRRRAKVAVNKGDFDRLPYKTMELTNQWDLGGDGKCFWGFHPEKDWYLRSMRK